MKKIAMLLLLLPLLTGCWDQMQLRNLRLVDVVGFDWNDESKEVKVNLVVTKLLSAGQGTGNSLSENTELEGASTVEAIGKGGYTNKGPFVGISSGFYLMSQSFAAHDPISELAFLINTPYSTASSPIIVFEGDPASFLETNLKTEKEFTRDLTDIILYLEENKSMPSISLSKFIQSRNDPLLDVALPVFKEFKSGVELNGSLLFHNGLSTGAKLEREQNQMMMIMLGKDLGQQNITLNQVDSKRKQKTTDQVNKNIFVFSINKNNTDITISNKSSRLPKVNIKVRLRLHIFELDNKLINHKDAKELENKLSKHLENLATSTIETMQKVNSDALGIGMQIKAYHPKIWKTLNWDKDFQKITVKPDFDVQILNSDRE